MTLVYLAAYYVLMVTSWFGETVVYALTPMSIAGMAVSVMLGHLYRKVFVKVQRGR